MPKGKFNSLGNLVFRFDKALVADSLLNQWDSTDYVDFEPKIPGRFRWEAPDQLVFSPARPLPPATSFKATINNDVLQHSKYGKIGKAEDLAFSTPFLQLDNTNVTWTLTDERSTNAIPQVDLYFNYPINPATIKEKLKLEIGGKTANYDVITLSNDSKVSLRVLGIKAEDKDLDAVVTLDKGLIPEGGTNGTKEGHRKQTDHSFPPST